LHTGRAAEGPFSPGWRDPNARHYANVPVHSPDGDTDSAPPTMGFADIGGGLHGSRQSLNRPPSIDAGPGRGGSNPSVNRSQDSSTAGTAAVPRTRVARGSNPSLNRSVSWSLPGRKRGSPELAQGCGKIYGVGGVRVGR